MPKYQVARVDPSNPGPTNDEDNTQTPHPGPQQEAFPRAQASAPQSNQLADETQPIAAPGPPWAADAPTVPGPSVAGPQLSGSDSDGALSPYTFERQRLRDLTMPTHANFAIPSSTSPPPKNSEEAATLAATTKKFDRFLELKKQGLHFNARLLDSASLRNPSLLPKLMDFAGISEDESRASTFDVQDGGVPVEWPEEWYAENLVKENERRERKAKEGRKEVEFVSAAAGGKSGASSKAGTPRSAGGSRSARSVEQRKSRFD